MPKKMIDKMTDFKCRKALLLKSRYVPFNVLSVGEKVSLSKVGNTLKNYQIINSSNATQETDLNSPNIISGVGIRIRQ